MRIAVCDDDPVLAKVVLHHTKQQFEKDAPELLCEYRMFFDPVEMVNEHERAPFDIAFLDIEMPGLNGFECADLMRKYNKDLEVLFVTSHGEYMEDSFDFGAFWFVEKSFDWKDLKKAVKKLISGEKRARSNPKPREPKEPIGCITNQTVFYSAARNSVVYHFPDGSTKTEYTTLNKIVENNLFCYRINKSIVVNFYYAKAVIGRKLIMYNDTIFKITPGWEIELEAKLFWYRTDPGILLDNTGIFFNRPPKGFF